MKDRLISWRRILIVAGIIIAFLVGGFILALIGPMAVNDYPLWQIPLISAIMGGVIAVILAFAIMILLIIGSLFIKAFDWFFPKKVK